MKKILAMLLVLVAALAVLAACGDTEDPITYFTVEFDSNGAEKYTSRQLAEGSLVIEPQTPSRGGYYFTGWYCNGELWNFETDTVSGNIKLTAGWKRVTFAVSFDSNGGAETYPDSVVPSGDPVSAPQDPTRDGYTFLGWYYNGVKWNFAVEPVVSNITLTAEWEEIVLPVYKVTFDSAGGTSVPEKSVTEGDAVAAPTAPTKAGHNFLGWYLGEALYDFSAPVVGDLTLTAHWEEIIIPTYTVTFDSNGGSAIEAQHPVENTLVAKPQNPIYPTSDTEIRSATFLGWYLGENLYDFSTPVVADITLTAKWSVVIYYKITFVAEGADGYPQTFIIEKGEPIPVLTPAKDDFVFAGWYNGEKPWNSATDLPTANTTLTARWTPIPTYRVVFDTKGGSTVAVQTVKEGGFVKEPGKPSLAGHRFDGWYYGEELWNFNTMTVNEAITLTAKWVEQVNVVFNDTDGTRIYSRVVDKGALIPEYAGIPTKKNYRFDGWYSGETAWDFATMTANGDIELVPKWVRQYTVTFNTGCDIVIPTQLVDENGYVSRPDTPQRGTQYSFDGWYIENTEIEWVFKGEDAMTVDFDVVLEARWSIMTPPDIFIK